MQSDSSISNLAKGSVSSSQPILFIASQIAEEILEELRLLGVVIS